MTITPTQLNNYIKAVFDTDEILLNVVVKGEITNLKNSHGNYYFALKDEFNQVECFSYKLPNIELCDGHMVEISGCVNFNTKFGRVSLYVKSVKIDNDVGEQYKRFLKLKEKLEKEGLFDIQRKKPIPSICKTVAVVTSKDGAVVKDIEQVIFRRQPSTNILLYSVHVQGEFAPEEICQAVSYFSNSQADVVIVARGGGSNEDLSAFNSEKVVRAISECKVPIISAIGHGIDFTLADFVADKRAVTPSEAAELVSIDVQRVAKDIGSVLEHCQQAIMRKKYFLRKRIQNIMQVTTVELKNQISIHRSLIMGNLNEMSRCIGYCLQDTSRNVENLLSRLSSNNPTNILKRGYLLAEKDGKKIKSVYQLSQGEQISLTLHDGKATAVIDYVGAHKEGVS